MKTLQDITTSLELSKKLKEVGFPQDTYFYWSKNMDLVHWRVENREFYKVDLRTDIAAPTAEELLEWLPAYIDKKQGLWLSLEKIDTATKNKYKACYGDEGISYIERVDNTPANAIARMVIYLAKNKIIKFER